MRKVNSVITIIIILLLLEHAVIGGFNMAGIGGVTTQMEARLLLVLILVHAIIGIILTVRTLRTQGESTTAYYKANKMFWARRISGFMILLLVAFHVLAFRNSLTGQYALPEFTTIKLIANILFAIAVIIHLILNARPALISMGFSGLDGKTGDVIFWATVLMVFFVIAFVVYYIRWSAL